MSYRKIFLTLILGLGLWFLRAQDHNDLFTLAGTIQNNMVVQQGEPWVMWGTAQPGVEMKVRTDWTSEEIVIQAQPNGIWKAQIPIPIAQPGDFQRHQVEIISGEEKMVISDILFGDVWLCSGQSNMAMELKPFLPWILGVYNYRMEIENADYPEIRFFKVDTDFKKEPQTDCGGEWQICSPDIAGDFSAVAYFFARQVFLKTQIPIGMIISSVGASSCQAWTSRDTLANDPLLNDRYLFPFDTSHVSKEPMDSVVTFEKVVYPTVFYNAMIHPLKEIALKGVLWYQGEGNRGDGDIYARLMSSMVRNWRTLFRNDQLPFYYVQVAPYNWMETDTTAYEYALLREAQAKVRLNIPNSEMIVTMDIADPDDIHPRNKQDVGYRLSRVALSKDYHFDDVSYRGPEYLSHRLEDGYVKIAFENAESGLVTNDGRAPRHFYLAGEDGIFYHAVAKIEDNEVWLKSEIVKNPVAIRYAFTNFPVTNLENGEGLPALPFRSSENF